MAGETDLDKLLALMQPKLLDGDFVFCSVPGSGYGDLAELEPLASYQEDEGLSLLLAKNKADAAGMAYHSVFKGITLSVHSSLDAVGFSAAVAGRLAADGIPCNMIAAHYHDHVFVPEGRAEQALRLLEEFGRRPSATA